MNVNIYSQVLKPQHYSYLLFRTFKILNVIPAKLNWFTVLHQLVCTFA